MIERPSYLPIRRETIQYLKRDSNGFLFLPVISESVRYWTSECGLRAFGLGFDPFILLISTKDQFSLIYERKITKGRQGPN